MHQPPSTAPPAEPTTLPAALAEIARPRELLELRDLPVQERLRVYLLRHPEAARLTQVQVGKVLGISREMVSRSARALGISWAQGRRRAAP